MVWINGFVGVLVRELVHPIQSLRHDVVPNRVPERNQLDPCGHAVKLAFVKICSIVELRRNHAVTNSKSSICPVGKPEPTMADAVCRASTNNDVSARVPEFDVETLVLVGASVNGVQEPLEATRDFRWIRDCRLNE